MKSISKKGWGESKESTPKNYQVYTLNIAQLMTQGEGTIIVRLQRVSFIASCHRDYWKLNKAVSSCYCYQLASSHFHSHNNCHMPVVYYLWAANSKHRRSELQTALTRLAYSRMPCQSDFVLQNEMIQYVRIFQIIQPSSAP